MAHRPKTGGRRPATRKTINLALQGGGAHGAFTWGVLDRLLEDERLKIVGISGASAGAMNAAVMVSGLVHGGPDDARARLRAFWEEIGRAAWASPLRRSAWERIRGEWNLDASPGYLFFDLLSRIASPYDLNPLDINPLRDVLSRQLDMDAVRTCADLALFISATNVKSGRAVVFKQGDLTIDHVMASACLPFMFKAVEIDGVPYWDGGYMGNPPLYPLFDHSEADDIVIVQINPLYRDETPRTAREILDRVNEITFNASLMRELRAVDFVSRLMEAGRMDGTGYRRVLVHMIEDEPMMEALGASSKMNAEAAFLEMLFEKGRGAADRWLDDHFDDLGRCSSLDIASVFQCETDPLDGERITRAPAYQDQNKPRKTQP